MNPLASALTSQLTNLGSSFFGGIMFGGMTSPANLGGIQNLLKDAFSFMNNLIKGQNFKDFVGNFSNFVPQPGNFPKTTNTMDPAGSLTVEGNKITTPGGYTIENKGNSEFSITAPNGKKTTVWGDPHIKNTEGKHIADWDEKTATFMLPDGTKITANATDKLGLTTDFHVYYGNQHVECKGTNTANPTTSAVRYDAAVHDQFQKDGSQFFIGGDGDDLFKSVNGQLREVVGGGGNAELKYGGGFWIDSALREAANKAGLPYDKVMNPENVMPFLPPNLRKILENKTAQTGNAGGAGGAGGAAGTGETEKKSFHDMLKEADKNAQSDNALAQVLTGGPISIEDLIMGLMKEALKSESANAYKLAQSIRDKKKAAAGMEGQAKGEAQADIDYSDFELQQATQRLSRLYQALSNIMKSFDDAKMTAVRNMKA